MIHDDRVRAGSFGADAALYDALRPSYPTEMVDDIMMSGPRVVLDIGCGTGIAARLFAARRCEVLGVEPDPRMAAVAQESGLTVDIATFEDWDAMGRTFDLAISAQAWHWVDPVLGPAKVASVLARGGRFAIFSNRGRQDEPLRERLEAVYEQIAPEAEAYSVLVRNIDGDRIADTAASFAASERFTDLELRRYPWKKVYGRDAWLEHLLTHPDHGAMAPDRRAALFAELSEVIDAAGGTVPMEYESVLVKGTVAN